jgi:hypothetical protein
VKARLSLFKARRVAGGATPLFPVVSYQQNGRWKALDDRTKIEQTANIERQEGQMTGLVQDVVSMVCMGTFLISMAFWIGAL